MLQSQIWHNLKLRQTSEPSHYITTVFSINVRDQPFNLQEGLWFFVSFRIFFSDNTRVRILIFFQNLTLDYMTKTLNQIIFFPPPKSEYFFSATLGIRIFFLLRHWIILVNSIDQVAFNSHVESICMTTSFH
jgi:hypothetical protein